jgi:hypothetical protein
MRYRFGLAVLTAVLVVGTGCQDYNFNPVGRCLIQPGSERVTLSNISSADVLFVVDDSGSMLGEQRNLGRAFGAFISNLDRTNAERVENGLEPIDFHIAVTSSSVFRNPFTGHSCANDCTGSAGTLTCCNTSKAPLLLPRACTTAAQCTGGAVCTDACTGYAGQRVCCSAASGGAVQTEPVRCATAGEKCGALDRHYRFTGTCEPGNAVDDALYPQGAFVGLGTQPRVLHFDKSLYPATPPTGAPVNQQGFTRQQLVDFFAREAPVGSNDWQGNVIVGTCGSGQEQHLEAARRAIQKATGGQQRDTHPRTSGSPVAGGVPAEFPKPEPSKLVLVFVGDEDDCASPEDPVRGVVFEGPPGNDACTNDVSKRFPVDEIVDYFFTLGRPIGAAFIASTAQDSCVDAECAPGICCDRLCTGTSACTSDVCGGQAASTRLLRAAERFRARGADVVVGSMCDRNFNVILDRIAEIVKPPRGLVLPTQPAASEVAVLRIVAGETTRKTCAGPAPATTDPGDLPAIRSQYDWWFTATRDQVTETQILPTAASRFVYINLERGNCIANPGETYSADYLGRLPATGCTRREDCSAALGGDLGSWACTGTIAVPGTCICCGTGSTDSLCTAP